MKVTEILQAIGQAKGAEKISIIKQHQNNEVFINVLQFAYNPFMRYGVTNIKIKQRSMASFETMAFMAFNLLEDLQARRITGQEAKNACMKLGSTMSNENAQVFTRILKKDLRVGISIKTINKAIPGLVPIFEVMRAKTFKLVPWSQPMYVSLKLDGLRGYTKPGGIIYTRNGHVIQGLDHILEAFKDFDDTAFDGELMVPGMEFNAASGEIRSHRNSAEVVYHVFDLPELDKPFNQRYKELKAIVADINSPYIQLVKHTKVQDFESVEQQFTKALAAGYEGLMLKTWGHKYQMKRSSDWLKLKPDHDEDVRISGFYEGEGKYTGMLGGILVERPNGVTAKVGGGFSDDLRSKIWNNQDEYLGHLVEVKYFEDTPSGDYRHARFKRFRGDKG